MMSETVASMSDARTTARNRVDEWQCAGDRGHRSAVHRIRDAAVTQEHEAISAETTLPPGLAMARTPAPRSVSLQRNTGRPDRMLRAVVAVLLLYVVWGTTLLSGDPLVSVPATVFALLNVFASITGWCPMYCISGSDTRARSGT